MPLPLIGENRLLVQRGLAELNRPRRPGIQALIEEARLMPGRIRSVDIGFGLGPRINAAGRLDSAMRAYDLLTAPDVLTARALAADLGDLNRRRQAMTQELVARAKEKIAAEGAERELFLVSDPGFPSGIVGLVAGRLVEELYRPVMLVEEDQNGSGLSRGSARSIPEFNVTAALDECRDLLVRHGGHALAAGFTVANERLSELRARLEAIAARELGGKDLAPTLSIDAVVQLEDLDWAMLDMLRELEPHGHGNPQPVFVSQDVEVMTERTVGQARQHLKLTLHDPLASGPRSFHVWDAIGFNLGGWSGRLPRRVDLAFTFESSEFGGDSRLQLNVKDLRASEGEA
jgi:single-stranded-DNA-specific exonuclease